MNLRTIKKPLAVALGAAAGFAYYYYIGCASGTCPITGNPWISTAYGAVMGWLLVSGGSGKKRGSDNSGGGQGDHPQSSDPAS